MLASQTDPQLPAQITPAERLLTAAEFHRMADVPPEIEWFANIRNRSTRRVYENAIRDFMRFTGIARPEEFRTVTRAHVIAWRDDLARRELAGLDEPDPTLVRHLRDLHALREHYDAADVIALAREVMLADAEAYGNQFPAYRENPIRETLRAVEGLAVDPGYARRYGEFQRLMVYGEKVEYAT
jgi:integrase/recombinase XerD